MRSVVVSMSSSCANSCRNNGFSASTLLQFAARNCPPHDQAPVPPTIETVVPCAPLDFSTMASSWRASASTMLVPRPDVAVRR